MPDQLPKIETADRPIKYNVHRLIYFDELPSLSDALAREKQIKGYTRIKKVALIVAKNPSWRDLYDDIAKAL